MRDDEVVLVCELDCVPVREVEGVPVREDDGVAEIDGGTVPDGVVDGLMPLHTRGGNATPRNTWHCGAVASSVSAPCELSHLYRVVRVTA